MRGWRCAAVVGAVTTMIAGCGLPTSSSVHVVRRILTDQQQVDPDIRRIAPGPAEGATPEQIVRGFFAAESNDDDQHAVARQFLSTPTLWDASGGSEVYDEASLRIAITQRGDLGQAAVSFSKVGMVDSNGSFAAADTTVTETMRLRRIAGQWRLSAVPVGLQLSVRDIARSLTSTTVWFMSRDPAGARLVPDPRLLPAPTAGLASALVRAMLAGPSRRLAPAVRTAVPPGTQLQGTAVLVDGEVTIDLSQQAANLRGEELKLFLAQLAVTLQQVPGALRLRLTANGRGIGGGDPSVGELARLVGALPATADEPPARAPRPIGVRGGQIENLGSTAPSAQPPGAVWRGVTGLTAIATDPDSGRIAALHRDGQRQSLLVGTVSGMPSTILGPDNLDAISLVPDGRVLAHRGGAAPALLLVDRAVVSKVSLPGGLDAGSISTIAVARDGVHVALIVGAGQQGKLVVAALVLLPQPRLVELATDVPTPTAVSSAAWLSATHLVVTGVSGSRAVRPFDLLVDGSAVTPMTSAGLPGSPSRVASWPGSRLLAVARDQACVLGSGWSVLGRADAVAYI